MALSISNPGSSSGGRRAGGRNNSIKTGARKTFNRPGTTSHSYGTSTGSTQPQTQSYSQPSSYSSSSYGSPSGGSYPTAPVSPPIPSEADYLAGDATYQATLAALKKQIQNFTSDITTQRDNRALDYDKALDDLGYIAPDPNARGAGPSWDWNDTLTASGRANQNQLNDFASRGMLRSSGYADSLQDLTRSLTDQYTGIDQANTQFNTDLDRQLTRAKDENTSASQAARAEAIMRRAAQYGFGV